MHASPDRQQIIRRRLQEALGKGFAHLMKRGALEAVIVAVRLLEDDPLFNAGTGSSLQEDAKVRMSASVMDGSTRRFAGVINIERVRNPVLVARALLKKEDRILAGIHAERFARRTGFKPWNPVTEERLRMLREKLRQPHGTVGAVAVDRRGRLAAATSTGGKMASSAGRVSDSALPAGNYATELAAISCTGLGEDIVDEAVAVRIAQKTADRTALSKAFAAVFKELMERKRKLGAIGVDRLGRLAWSSTLPCLYAAGRSSGRLIETF